MGNEKRVTTGSLFLYLLKFAECCRGDDLQVDPFTCPKEFCDADDSQL